MPVITVRSDSDIKKIKMGSAYIIDVFPPADSESQEFKVSAFKRRDDLQKNIEIHLSAGGLKKNPGRGRNNAS